MRHSSFVERGGLWVAAQFVVIPALVLIAALARARGLEPAWPAPLSQIAAGAGALLLLSGAALLIAAVARLGKNLTPFPQPLRDGTLVDSGAYSLVRHPIYAAIIAGCAGLALASNSLFGLMFSALVLLFFDRKAAFEERLLERRFPDYPGYRRRVKKLIPYVY